MLRLTEELQKELTDMGISLKGAESITESTIHNYFYPLDTFDLLKANGYKYVDRNSSDDTMATFYNDQKGIQINLIIGSYLEIYKTTRPNI